MKNILLLLFFSVIIFSCEKIITEPTKSSAKRIVSFEISISNQRYQASIDSVKNTVTLYLPFGTEVSQIAPLITHSENSVISPASNQPQDFSKNIIYKVTAEDGSAISYSVIIVFAPPKSKEKTVSSGILSIDNQEIKIDIDTIKQTLSIVVPYGTNISNLSPKINISDKATINPASGSQQDFTTPVAYTITAEDGSSVVYTFVVKVSKPSSSDLQKMSNKWENTRDLKFEMINLDVNGNIWCANNKYEGFAELIKIQNGKEIIIDFSKFQAKQINDILEFDHSIWVGTTNGIINISGKDTTKYNLPNNDIKSLHVFDNQLFCSTTTSIYKLENSKWTLLATNQNEVFIDFVVTTNYIYIITAKSLLKYDGTFKKVNHSLKYSDFETIKIDSQGAIWISHWSGIVKFENDNFTYFDYSTVTGMPDSGLDSFIIDKYDNIWMAWKKHGVVVFQNGAILHTFNKQNSNIISDNTSNIVMKDNMIAVACFDYRGLSLPTYMGVSKLKIQ